MATKVKKMPPYKSNDLWIFPPENSHPKSWSGVFYKLSVACASARDAAAYRAHHNAHETFQVQTWRTELSKAVHFVRADKAGPLNTVNARRDAPKSTWVVFDLVNSSPIEVGGNAYVFLFETRAAALSYIAALNADRSTGRHVITVSAPIRFVQP